MKDTAKNYISRAQHIGIVTPQSCGPDAFAAAFALCSSLAGTGKDAVFTVDLQPPVGWSFLPVEVVDTQRRSNNLTISIPTSTSPIKEIRYEEDGDFVHVILVPKNGEIKKETVRVGARAPGYDLVVTVGIQNPEQLGKEFDENPGLFANKPVINIDTSPQNENFGTVNIIGKDKSSLSELVYELLTDELEVDITTPGASWLLAGIIEQTDNFRNTKTTPSALEVASFLLEIGADKEMIIKNIYKTRPLPLLKLWGRASIRSRFDKDTGTLWTFIPGTDFEKTKTRPEDISFVLKQFREYFELPRLFVILFEDPGARQVQIALQPANTALLSALLNHADLQLQKEIFAHRRFFKTFPEAEMCASELIQGIKGGGIGSAEKLLLE